MPVITTTTVDKYGFRRATKEDAPALLEAALKGFIHEEPHSKVTANMTSVLHDRRIVEKSVHSPYSVVVHERASRKMVGFRLYSVSHRDESKDFSPFEIDIDSLSENTKILANLLDNQKYQICSKVPEAQKVLRQEITFVYPSHQRQGIANHFIRLIDFDQLKRDGFAGIQSEATSHANQKLLAKLGYTLLSESDPSEYILHDGTELILPDETKQLFFLPFQQRKCA